MNLSYNLYIFLFAKIQQNERENLQNGFLVKLKQPLPRAQTEPPAADPACRADVQLNPPPLAAAAIRLF